MSRLYKIKNFLNVEETDIFMNEEESALAVTCSLSGKIKEVPPGLREVLGGEFVGKNLNEILDDNVVAGIVAASMACQDFEFGCLVNHHNLSGHSERDGDDILVYLTTGISGDRLTVSEEALESLNAEFNDVFSSIIGTMDHMDSQTDPRVMFVRKNIFRFQRSMTCTLDNILCENGRLPTKKSRQDIVQIVRDVAGMIVNETYTLKARIMFEDMPQYAFCDIDAAQAERMMMIAISHLIRTGFIDKKYADIKIRGLRRKNDVMIVIHGEFLEYTEDERTLGFNPFDPLDARERMHREIKSSVRLIRSLALNNNGTYFTLESDEETNHNFIFPLSGDTGRISMRSRPVRYPKATKEHIIELADVLPETFF